MPWVGFKMYALSDYNYELPLVHIAQAPCEKRSESKLFHLNRETNTSSHHQFKDILSLLRKDDLLVVNNTKVIPARLYGKKATGGKVEILIIDYVSGMRHLEKYGFFQCECLVKASKRPKIGSQLFLNGNVAATVVDHKQYISTLKFSNSKEFGKFLNSSGEIPLPPYIRRDESHLSGHDKTDYQTVYATQEGAVAAPTAGLHFTDDLMDALKNRGIEFAQVTLHVGYGTFVPVRVDDIREHQIHSESFDLSKEDANRINQAKKENRRIIAVGTTSVRTLEYIADEDGLVSSQSGSCDLYIYPGYKYKCIDAMITNFHLPESTLLMLISAFYDREKIMDAYQEAIALDYRFFSYGDAMFIE